MDLRSEQLKDTYGNLVTTGTTAGSPTSGGLQNGQGTLLTAVGIGTNTPAEPLRIGTVSGDTYAVFDDGTKARLTFNGDASAAKIFSTTTNFAAYEDLEFRADNYLFKVGTSEKMRIDSNGNVGMNAVPENSAGTWRNYQLGSLSMAGRAVDSAPDAMFGTNFKFTTANAEQRISAHATSRIFFNDDVITFQNAGSDTAGSAISWNERMRILSSGGITFNGDTATANALDDYEEGTWSPVYTPASGSFTTMTMDILSATYTKIGRQVTVRGYFRTDEVVAGTASGGLLVSGLPFASGAVEASGGSVGYVENWGSSPDSCVVNANSSQIRLRKTNATTDVLPSDLTTGATINQNTIILTATYFV